MYLFIIFAILSLLIYKLAIRSIKSKEIDRLSRNDSYFGLYVLLWSILPSLIIFIVSYFLLDYFIHNFYLIDVITSDNRILKEVAINEVIKIASHIRDYGIPPYVNLSFKGISNEVIVEAARKYLYFKTISTISLFVVLVCFSLSIFFWFLKRINFSDNFQRKIEFFIKNILLVFAAMAVLTTIGILLSLLFESYKFFSEVSIFNFIFGLSWTPESSDLDPNNSFGVIPLLAGTFLISFIAIFIASIVGVSSAIYMSEYMSKKSRRIIKPMIEILAGIPSIVYGFFAALTFSPILVGFFREVFGISISSENALNAGIIMGVMIIPLISSMSDDILNSIPNSMREGAMGMGSMKNEMIRKILLPAAMPGVIGSVLLGVSRAIGETMIVVMASSLAANLTFNPLEPVTTITTQIVMLVQGDQEFNSPKTLSAFALGLLLLILTLILNIIAIKIVNKYKGKYG